MVTQGLVKELWNHELGHPREGKDGGIGRAGCRARNNVSTHALLHSGAPDDLVGMTELI
jgi:hypothetical protein